MDDDFLNLCILVGVVALVMIGSAWWRKRRLRHQSLFPPLGTVYVIRVEGMGVVFSGQSQPRAIAAFEAYKAAAAGRYRPPPHTHRTDRRDIQTQLTYYNAPPYILPDVHVDRAYRREIQMYVDGVPSGIYVFHVYDLKGKINHVD